ncbi:hypothetical protein ALC53_01943, partial [Atta colombica]
TCTLKEQSGGQSTYPSKHKPNTPVEAPSADERERALTHSCTYALAVLGGRRVLIARGDVCC